MVLECDVCQRCKGEHVAYPGLLQPLPLPSRAWEHITIDFIEGVPKSEGKNTIFVIVDRFSKYAHFLSLSHPFTVVQVARLFMDNIYRLHGLPTSIVSDMDKIFLSLFWKELFKGLKIELKFSSAYHPQSDGKSERVNQCVENYLRCMSGHKPKDWHKWLSLAEYWYNSNYHTSTQSTPFKILYGYDPPQLYFELVTQSKVDEADQWLQERKIMTRILKVNLEKAQ